MLDSIITIGYIYLMYTVTYTKTARKMLQAMPAKKAQQIKAELQKIAQDPMAQHPQVKKLQGREGYRLRVGDWRAIYTLEHNQLVLSVIAVASRGDIYKH